MGLVLAEVAVRDERQLFRSPGRRDILALNCGNDREPSPYIDVAINETVMQARSRSVSSIGTPRRLLLEHELRDLLRDVESDGIALIILRQSNDVHDIPTTE